MINAQKANSISKEMAEKIIDKIINQKYLMTQIEQTIISSADSGSNYCYYSFKDKTRTSWSELIKEKAKPLIKEFEAEGYKVILCQSKNKHMSTVYICLYWGDSYEEYKTLMHDANYGGDEGVLYFTLDFFNEFS